MYNNYGFNPYYQPQRFTGVPQQPSVEQPIQQPIVNNTIQNRQILNGKLVDGIDVVKGMDIPLDGSVSYFPLTDGSAIVTKQLQTDGTSKTIVFKPVDEEKATVRYITPEELEKSLKNIDLSEIDDLKDEFNDLKKDLKEIQKKLKNKGE